MAQPECSGWKGPCVTAYYNEIDPYAAQWLRNLIAAGHLPDGEVDERSIAEVEPGDLRGFDECHFFAGIGGWPLALRMAGWTARNTWTGSAPCQPFSSAGQQRGADDERHLWPEFFRLIRECRPPAVFGEQVAAAIKHGWLDGVASDLEGEGYAVGAAVLGAHSVGAPHRRDRLYFVAHAEWDEQSRQEPCGGTAGRVGRVEQSVPWDEPWESALSRFRVVGDGLPRSVGATDAARNAIVPQAAAQFVRACM
jgi:DNA (cytosine-5)-methyltransferase 1